MAFAAEHVGVAGMFIVESLRLDERHRGQRPSASGGDERALIEQMLLSCRRSFGVTREVNERLVMVLKVTRGMTGVGVAPAAGVPGPRNPPIAQTVAYGRVRQRRHQLRRFGIARSRSLNRGSRLHDEPVRRRGPIA